MSSIGELKQQIAKLMADSMTQQQALLAQQKLLEERKSAAMAIFAQGHGSGVYERIRGGQANAEIEIHNALRALRQEMEGFAEFMVRLG